MEGVKWGMFLSESDGKSSFLEYRVRALDVEKPPQVLTLRCRREFVDAITGFLLLACEPQTESFARSRSELECRTSY